MLYIPTQGTIYFRIIFVTCYLELNCLCKVTWISVWVMVIFTIVININHRCKWNYDNPTFDISFAYVLAPTNETILVTPIHNFNLDANFMLVTQDYMVVNIACGILQTGLLLQRKWLSNLNALLSSNIESRDTSRICEIVFQNIVSDILSTPTHLMITLKNGNLRSIVILILWQFSVYQNPVKWFIFSDVYQILIYKQHYRIVISFIFGGSCFSSQVPQ